MGVRGIALAEGDSVISLAILNAFDATADERAAYLKQRRALSGETAEEPGEAEADGEDGSGERLGARARALRGDAGGRAGDPDRVGERLRQAHRRPTSTGSTGRGGKGIVAMAVNERNGALVASFPVENSDEIMLVTDGGQLIRVPVAGIRIAGRATQGVIVFNTAEGERVVSVDRIGETEESEDEAV